MSKDNQKQIDSEEEKSIGLKRLDAILKHHAPNNNLEISAPSIEKRFEDWSAPMFFQSVKDPRTNKAKKLAEELAKRKKDKPSTTDIPPKVLSEEEKRFEPSEHDAIGNRAFKHFIKILRDEHKPIWQALNVEAKWQEADGNILPKFQLSKDIALTPGQIVCLAGDFYGVPGQPICEAQKDEEQETRFGDAYDKLVNADLEKLQKLLNEIDKNSDIIRKEIQNNRRPRIALIKQGEKSDRVYAEITKSTFWPGRLALLNSDYLDLAQHNFDHFGDDARTAYRAGHRVAITTAIKAKTAGADKIKLLAQALTQELFACHYLTDLFAAGHIRVPRRELLQESYTPSLLGGKLKIAGLVAKEMHDEDSRTGFYVKSKKHPKPWKVLGDDCYFEPENATNMEQLSLSVQAGLLDVVQASISGKKETVYPALDYVPQKPTLEQEAEIEKETKEPFPAPLLEARGGTVFLRNEVDGREGRAKCTYTSAWAHGSFLTSRKIAQSEKFGGKVNFGEKAKEPLTDFQKKALTAEYQDLSETKDVVTCKMM